MKRPLFLQIRTLIACYLYAILCPYLLFDIIRKTLYLLHGISGNDFYVDREATGRQYCQFAGKEAVEYTRKAFGLSSRPEDTFIGGLSMGGFGALHTALAFPETFGAAIALSSALIISKIKGMKKGVFDGIASTAYYEEVFGDLKKVDKTDANPEVLYDRLAAAGKKIPPIYMAIGTEDFLYEANQEFQRFLDKRGADFFYEEGPGIHNWDFWNPYIVKGVEWALDRVKDGGDRVSR